MRPVRSRHDYDPTDVHANRRRAEEETELARMRREIADSDVRHQMETELGRRFVWRLLLKDMGAANSVFNPNGLVMARNAARRDIADALTQRLLALCPDKYLLMRRENS